MAAETAKPLDAGFAFGPAVNREDAKRVRDITGDRIIQAARMGDRVSLSLSIQNLLPLIPRVDLQYVKLTGAVSGQVGRYTGYTYSGAVNLAATGNISAADLGTASTTQDITVWFPADIGLSANSLTPSTGTPVYGVAKIAGTNSAGQRIGVLLGASGGTLPVPTAQFQVLSCTSFTSSTVYTVAYDYLRAT